MRRSLRFSLALAAALAAFERLRRVKDSVTIGMTLEPPGLDPDLGRRPPRSARSCITTSSRA